MILDIRTPQEFARGHVPGAINVPTPPPPLKRVGRRRLRAKLRRVTKSISKSTQIYVYCKKGIRAGIAKRMLTNMGFRHVTNLGGVEQHPLPSLVQSGRVPWSWQRNPVLSISQIPEPWTTPSAGLPSSPTVRRPSGAMMPRCSPIEQVHCVNKEIGGVIYPKCMCIPSAGGGGGGGQVVGVLAR